MMSNNTSGGSGSGSSSSSNGNTNKEVHAIVIAHPDDESMFFIPTIQALVAPPTTTSGAAADAADEDEDEEEVQRSCTNEVWLLCLTTGDYDGLGRMRTRELIDVCKLIGISKLVILNDGDDDGDSGDNETQTATKKIIDHPRKRWDPQHVSKIIRQMLVGEIGSCHYYQSEAARKPGKQQQQQQQQDRCSSDDNLHVNLITFDEGGVSGHINHVDTYSGVCQLLKEEYDEQEKDKHSANKIVLQSASILHTETNILVKYIPVWSWVFLFIHVVVSFFVSRETSARTRCTTIRRSSINNTSVAVAQKEKQTLYRLNDPLLNWKAMKTHQSQFVWYRRLFVVFSCYTYYNILTPIIIERTASPSATNSPTTIDTKKKKML